MSAWPPRSARLRRGPGARSSLGVILRLFDAGVGHRSLLQLLAPADVPPSQPSVAVVSLVRYALMCAAHRDRAATAALVLVGPCHTANKACMEALWNNFNEIAEGFGLNQGEFQRICDVKGLQVTPEDAAKMFAAFDTDRNGLVDALEFLTTFAVTSGLSLVDKVKYTFRCYDFDESNELTVDEMTLSLKSTLTGLAKLSGEEPPDPLELEDIAQQAFDKADKNKDSKITFEEYQEFATTNPEVLAWINYYDDPPEELADDGTLEDSELEAEGNIKDRSEQMEAARNPELGIEFEMEEELAGDQFTAVKPWTGTVNNLVPTSPPPLNVSAPDTTLEMEWIHGYRAQDARNNVRYTHTGEIAYTGAAVGIVYSQETHSQRFNVDHTDDIISLAVHPEGRFVATGEMGRKPKVIVWDSADTTGVMDAIRTIQGHATRAVILLSFSPDGRKLAAVGQDDDHTLFVYDWEKERKIYSEKSSKNKVLHMCWLDNNTLVTAGVKHILFWDLKSRTKKKGLWGRAKNVKQQPLLSLAATNDGATLVSGTASGHIYAWEGRNCVRAIKAHDANVAALWSCPAGLVSGGKDGKVRIWTHALEPKNVFDIATFGSVKPSIRSVCWDPSTSRLLIGTIGSEIYEINSTDGENLHHGPLVQGHFKDELWGLAVHPTKQEYVTVGDDGTLRRWDIATRKILSVQDLGVMARAVTYSPDGSQIAIGLGGDVGRGRRGRDRKDGGFIVLNESDLSVLHQARDSKQWISDIKYSPDGHTLALGSHDNKIWLYETSTFHHKGTCSKHTSYITHFDFSADSIFIQSNCGGYELLFFDANTGEQQVSAPAMRDVEWATWTCVLGWGVQGIWPKFADGTDINAVCRSASGRELVTADDFGRVKLFRYPCVEKDSQYHEYVGHSSHVTNCRFTDGDHYVITCGGNDRCVIQWRVDGEAEDAADEAKVVVDSDDEGDFVDGHAMDRTPEQERVNTMDMDMVFAMEEEMEADQFMAVKPWVGAIVEPTVPPKFDPSVPDVELSLEWVHGYRAQDARDNLRYTKMGEIVYTAAAVGITLNNEKWLQRFNNSHNDDVICLAAHPDGIHVATGQMGRKPRIVVWRTDTMETVSVIEGFHRRAVCNLAFDQKDGRMLASVGQDDDHTMAVFDWRRRKMKATAKGDKNKSLCLAFGPDGRTVVQAGVKHIKFHTFSGRNVKTKKGILGRKGKIQALLTAAFNGESALIGTADGHIYRFDGNQLAQSVKAHDGSVYCLHTTPEGIVSGGKDGRVKLWTPDIAEVAEFDMASLGSVRPSVRSVCWDTVAKKILVGTIGSEIWEISSTDGTSVHADGPLVQGHFKHELWGLAMHPTERRFITSGDDQTLRVWDIEQRRQIQMTDVGCLARAVAFSPDGDRIAVGLGGSVGRGKQAAAGKWLMLRSRDLEQLSETKDASQWISEVKFSPDGKVLAVGAHDTKIYLYDAGGDDCPLKAMFEKHNASITHFDFSSDGKFLQSNCGAYELLFSDANTGSHIPAASALKDVDWATWTCVLGWPVQGIWPKRADGTDINAVDRSPDGSLLATADDFGLLRVMRWPCLDNSAAYKEYRGHSSHVTNCRWTPDGRYVITTGGNDRSVFQWLVERDDADAGGGGAIGEPGEAEVMEDVGGFAMAIEEDAEADQFMAVKPWIGAIKAPTAPPPEDPSAPKLKLELEWAYGYRAQDTRNNLRYNDAGEIVYHTAAVGVIYDKVKHRQKFYQGHTDDIVAMAVDPTGNFVATGQQGRRPRVHVWDSESGASLCVMSTFHRRAVVSLQFSADGKQLISVGDDDDHSVAVWRTATGSWTDGVLQANSKGDRGKTLFSMFGVGDVAAVTGGVKHVRFWRLSETGLSSKKGAFGRKVSTVTCGAVVAGKIVTGSVSGHLYVWESRKIVKMITAHETAVNAVFAHPQGLVTGSKDGKVRLWTSALECTADIDMNTASPAPFNAGVRSVALNADASLLLVGTLGSEIYEVTVASRKTLLIHQAHCKDELWGLAMHPTARHLAATAGDDKTIRVWNLAEHRMIAMTELDAMTRAVSWSPDGTLLGAGLGGRVGRRRTGKTGKKDGGYVVVRADTMEVIAMGRDSKQWIQDVKFSPDGAMFGVGSHDNKIYLYDARGGRFALRHTCAKHSSYITHFDFSVDSSTIQSNCGAYELLFFNADTGDQITSATALRDKEWATWTCVLGWPVQGIWPAEADGTDINSVDRSHNGSFLATADDFGQVKVFNYPCVTQTPRPRFVAGNGHSSHVTNVRWSLDDSYMLTTGGNDRTVLQWRVERT